jgi:hypothetical protein
MTSFSDNFFPERRSNPPPTSTSREIGGRAAKQGRETTKTDDILRKFRLLDCESPSQDETIINAITRTASRRIAPMMCLCCILIKSFDVCCCVVCCCCCCIAFCFMLCSYSRPRLKIRARLKPATVEKLPTVAQG